jgi:hypothetical protein
MSNLIAHYRRRHEASLNFHRQLIAAYPWMSNTPLGVPQLAHHGQFLDQRSPPYIRTTGSMLEDTDHHLGQLPQGKCAICQPFLETLTDDQSCPTTVLMGSPPMSPERKTFYLSMPQTSGVRAGRHLRIHRLRVFRQRLQILA